MTETLLIWLFAGAYGLIGVLFALVWQHVIRCKGVGEDIAVIKAALLRIERDIGTHETGLRGQVHKLASDITPYILAKQQQERRR